MYLSDTPDVLFSVLGRETKVLVQTESDIVAIQSVGLETKVEEVLLKGDGNGRLAGGGETSEPDGGTLLLAKIGTLLARKASVPGDVAVAFVRKGEMLRALKGRSRGLGGARRYCFVWQFGRLTLPLLRWL